MPLEKPKIERENSTATLTIQWLSYAFWGWLALSLTWLSAIVFNFFVDSASNASDIGDSIIYPVSATIVLLIICVITDFFYSKREPVKKEGSANLLMIVHTVIFSLLAVAAAITAVFSVLNIIINASSTGPTIALLTALTVLLFLLALLFRIVLAGKVKHSRKIGWSAMGVIVVAILAAAIIGPVSYTATTKVDRERERAIQEISYQIDNFVNIKNRLPESLSELGSVNNGDKSKVVRDAIKNNTITYTIIEEGAKYQPCTSYDKDTLGWSNSNQGLDNEYSSYELYNAYHPKGKHCYNIRVSL